VKTIKRLRCERDLTQKQLSRLVGVKQPQISLWETGKSPPSPLSLARIAAALGVRPEDIAVRQANRETAAPVNAAVSVSEDVESSRRLEWTPQLEVASVSNH
jgi:transcriptional regulator with XRE-family HTH domain